MSELKKSQMFKLDISQFYYNDQNQYDYAGNLPSAFFLSLDDAKDFARLHALHVNKEDSFEYEITHPDKTVTKSELIRESLDKKNYYPLTWK